MSPPSPRPGSVNRAPAPGPAGQGRVSEDKALALLITSQDLEPGPKARSGAGRPGRGSQPGGRDEAGRAAQARGDFLHVYRTAGLFKSCWGLGCSCRTRLPAQRSLAGSHPPDPWPWGELRPISLRCWLQDTAEANPRPRWGTPLLLPFQPHTPTSCPGKCFANLGPTRVRGRGRHPHLAPSKTKVADSPTQPIWSLVQGPFRSESVLGCGKAGDRPMISPSWQPGPLKREGPGPAMKGSLTHTAFPLDLACLLALSPFGTQSLAVNLEGQEVGASLRERPACTPHCCTPLLPRAGLGGLRGQKCRAGV